VSLRNVKERDAARRIGNNVNGFVKSR